MIGLKHFFYKGNDSHRESKEQFLGTSKAQKMVFHPLTFMVGSVMNMRGENIISPCSENTLKFSKNKSNNVNSGYCYNEI